MSGSTPHSLDTRTWSDSLNIINQGTATTSATSQRGSSAVHISAIAASSVTLTLWSGATITVRPAIDTVYLFQCTGALVNSGTVSVNLLYR